MHFNSNAIAWTTEWANQPECMMHRPKSELIHILHGINNNDYCFILVLLLFTEPHCWRKKEEFILAKVVIDGDIFLVESVSKFDLQIIKFKQIVWSAFCFTRHAIRLCSFFKKNLFFFFFNILAFICSFRVHNYIRIISRYTWLLS